MSTIFGPPMTDQDYNRAVALAKFLADNKWTLAEAKRAFVMWYERVGMPREHGDVILMSDLGDFVRAVVDLRNEPEKLR